MTSPTNEMVDFVMRTDFKDLPKEVVHESKLVILDSIGIALAGIKSEKRSVWDSTCREAWRFTRIVSAWYEHQGFMRSLSFRKW